MKNQQELIDEYLYYCLKQRKLDEKTVRAYQIDLRQFSEFCVQKKLVTEKAVIRQYILHLHESYKQKTVKRKVASIKAFYSYLEDEEIIDDSPLRKIRTEFREEKILPRSIPYSVLQSLLSSMYSKKSIESTIYERKLLNRDIAVVETLFSTGIRISELCNLLQKNIDIEQGIFCIKGKGGKERYLQIGTEEVLVQLKKYKRHWEKELDASEFFFLNRYGERYSEQSARRMIQRYTQEAMIEIHITPHMFRHAFATLLLEEEVDIRFIQKMLGHASIMTWGIQEWYNEMVLIIEYYVTDSHGNVVQLTDESGKVIKDYDYDSFGNEVHADKKDENPFRYCGEYYDKETEEVYLRARYYQPTVGRFLTRDTYTGESGDPLSLHLYTYCGNDGMNKCDADGNAWTWIKNKWNAFCDTAPKCYNGAKTYVKKIASNVKKTAAKVIRGGVNYWKKTWLGKEFYKRTKSGSDWKVNLLLKLGGFEREKGKSIFHARDICIQKLGGYNNFYDFVFDSATNISKPLKYKFTDRKDYKFNMKRKYVIWAWKGDYLNLGAGCEVGFYNTYGSTKHYFFVKKIFTELEMQYNGNLINNYRPPKSKGEKVGHSWWITTFNAGMQNNVNPSKIGFRCVADLSVLKAYARKALERRLEKSKRWNVEGNKATLKWNY